MTHNEPVSISQRAEFGSGERKSKLLARLREPGILLHAPSLNQSSRFLDFSNSAFNDDRCNQSVGIKDVSSHSSCPVTLNSTNLNHASSKSPLLKRQNLSLRELKAALVPRLRQSRLQGLTRRKAAWAEETGQRSPTASDDEEDEIIADGGDEADSDDDEQSDTSDADDEDEGENGDLYDEDRNPKRKNEFVDDEAEDDDDGDESESDLVTCEKQTIYTEKLIESADRALNQIADGGPSKTYPMFKNKKVSSDTDELPDLLVETHPSAVVVSRAESVANSVDLFSTPEIPLGADEKEIDEPEDVSDSQVLPYQLRKHSTEIMLARQDSTYDTDTSITDTQKLFSDVGHDSPFIKRPLQDEESFISITGSDDIVRTQELFCPEDKSIRTERSSGLGLLVMDDTQPVSSSQQDTTQLLGLCSGQFMESVSSVKSFETYDQSVIPSRSNARPVDDYEEAHGGTYSPPKNIIVKRENVRLICDSDEESNDNYSRNQNKLFDNDDDIDDNDCDSDDSDNFEDELSEFRKHELSQNKFSDGKGKIRSEFIEGEAELSGSDASDDEAEHADDDQYEMEEGDLEVLPSTKKLKHELEQIHRKEMLAEDQRVFYGLKEKFIDDNEDGTLFRRFRWKVDNNEAEAPIWATGDDDENARLPGFVEEQAEHEQLMASQAMEIIEKREWLETHGDKIEFDLGFDSEASNSVSCSIQYKSVSSVARLSRSVSSKYLAENLPCAFSKQSEEIDLVGECSIPLLDSGSHKSRLIMPNRESLLNKDQKMLTRLISNDASNSAQNLNKCVFGRISPSKVNQQAKKRSSSPTSSTVLLSSAPKLSRKSSVLLNIL